MAQSNSSNPNSPNEPSSTEDDEISLLELAIALGEEKKTLFAVPLFTTAVAIVVSLIMTPMFTAKTLMMPPQQQQSSAASALASLGALAGLAGGAAGVKSPDEMYIAFMESESLQNSIVKKMSLQSRYESKTLLDARVALKGSVKITSDKKSGLISIEATDKDPVFAAQLANLYIDELHNLLGRLAVTDAQQRRVFYEDQIKKTQAEFASAEARFRAANEKSGMQVTSVLAETGMRANAEMRGQIAAKEVQLLAMSRFETAQNPDVQRLSSEISALRQQLSKLESGSGNPLSSSNFTPTQQEAVKAYRDIKVQESMLEVLIKQYELARVDEAKEGPLVQQVDPASPPERRSRPKRTLIVLVSALGGLFLGVLAAFVRRSIKKAANDPESSQLMSDLKRAWSWKKTV
jgi:tyrosine-protein kinase Etk/Wzc